MIGVILFLIPLVSLGIYLYRERSKNAIIRSITVLLALYIFIMLFTKVEIENLLIKSGLFLGVLGSWIYAIVLGFPGISGTFQRNKKTKLTKAQQGEAFQFSSKGKDLTIVNPFRGVLIVGGAGSGKSRTFMYPIIKQSAEKGYTGVLYDFKSPFNSQRANPLAFVKNAIQATNYSQALIYNLMPEYIQKQDFWSRSMLSILSGTIWYFRKNKPELATLPHIFAFLFTANAKEIVLTLSQDNEVKGYISSLAEAVEQGAEKQIAGVLGTLKNAIGIYNTPDLFWILSADETNLDVNNPENPTMLGIGNNSTLSDSYAPLCSLIITVCSKLMNEPGKLKSVIIVDESPTIYLPNFEQIPATARSNKVAVIVGAQDLSQMTDKYGRDKMEVLISNLGNQFYGRTTNRDTAERVVKMFGQREDIVELKGRSGGRVASALGFESNRNRSQSIQKRDRIKIQQITTLNAGEFAGLLAEGNTKEFLEPIDLEPLPDLSPVKKESRYSLKEANKVFEAIYSDIEDFLKKNKADANENKKSHFKGGYGQITDMDL